MLGLWLATLSQTRVPPSHVRDPIGPRPQALVDSSVLLARTLHGLAGGPDTPALELNRTTVRLLVAELAVCLILDDPGMRCPLASLLMSPGERPWLPAPLAACACTCACTCGTCRGCVDTVLCVGGEVHSNSPFDVGEWECRALRGGLAGPTAPVVVGGPPAPARLCECA